MGDIDETNPWIRTSRMVSELERQPRPLEEWVEATVDGAGQELDLQSGGVVFATRSGDPGTLAGWRPVWFHMQRSRLPKQVVLRLVRTFTWIRGVDFPDLASAGNERTSFALSSKRYPPGPHRALAERLGVAHRLMVWCPIDHDRLVVVLLDRRQDQPFDEDDTAFGEALAHRILPLATRWCAVLGITDGVLLTRRERQVQHCLAAGMTETEGADALGLRPSSFHQIVVRLYRKRGVTHRGELLARLLAPESTSGADVPTLLARM